ncbi:MAG: ADP-dependent NAD(P)H-hydrate dehydratase [Chloroflexota bacterium]|jgi:NAD(P)H-hydrate epimerase|nr:ADP-dependent NAD(P)H-hydrate dehydratase [Chloroflexota bacterium]
MTLERIDSLPTLPKRPPDSHKGMYGTVLAIAGGRGMAGAAALVGASALRSGAGLVRVASPAEVQPTVASFEPSYMTYPLENDDDGLVRFQPNLTTIGRLLERVSVLAIGPGLGQSGEIRDLVHWVVEEVQVPTVLDADALNALAGQTDTLSDLRRPVVITPHPGEFARLTGRSIGEIQADREGHAVALAQAADHLVVLLKGANTIITDGRRIAVNKTGNPGMATGGAGDVLTGVIAALMGQKLPAFEAAQLGAYVHGLAGDIARDQNGEISLIAGDIVDSLADAFYHLTS